MMRRDMQLLSNFRIHDTSSWKVQNSYLPSLHLHLDCLKPQPVELAGPCNEFEGIVRNPPYNISQGPHLVRRLSAQILHESGRRDILQKIGF